MLGYNILRHTCQFNIAQLNIIHWPHGEYNQCSPIATIVAIGEHWLYSPCGQWIIFSCAMLNWQVCRRIL